MSELECMRLAVKARLWPRPNPPRYAPLRQAAIHFRLSQLLARLDGAMWKNDLFFPYFYQQMHVEIDAEHLENGT